MSIHQVRAKATESHMHGTLFGRPRSSVIKHPGSFSKAAKSAGMSTAQYASHVLKPNSRASTTTKRRAALAKAFSTMRAAKR
jgi:hypothetical protein